MSKLWMILAGVVVAAVVAAAAYLNLTGRDPVVSEAVAASPGELQVAVGEDELIIGEMNAPVTIVEYASLTCPHCAAFHTESLPGIKEQFIDTGQARLVYRHFPLDQLALRAAVMVRCAKPEQRMALLDLLFSTQGTWARSSDPIAALERIGRSTGMSTAEIEACFNNEQVLNDVIGQRLKAEQEYEVNSTPSFIIGGKLYRGSIGVEQMKVIVEGLTE